MKKTILGLAIFSFFILGIVLFSNKAMGAWSDACPSQTTYTHNSATLVGEIRNTGGTTNLTGWFEWGPTYSLGNSTPRENLNVTHVPFKFCASIANLQPCTTYYYRAVAENAGGVSRGAIHSFTTQCVQVSVDVKANNRDDILRVSYNTDVTISWTSNNADSCSASGNAPGWSGSKVRSGSQIFSNLAVGTYTFTLTCTNNYGGSHQDTVTVVVEPRAPEVVTLPAVTTR
jgi:hypothetical protein